MHRSTSLLLLLLGVGVGLPATAAPLGLAWGVVAEPAVEGTFAPGAVAEHLEFLQAHAWQPLRLADLGRADLSAKSVVLSFDDPATAARYVLPLLELYRMPAVVTVGAAEAADPATEPALQALGSSPWIELAARVDAEPQPADATSLRCGPQAGAAGSDEAALSSLRATLTDQVARLRAVAGRTPTAVAWAPRSWNGAAEAVAASLGLTTQLPTFASMPPPLDGPRVARFAIPSWAGIWALAQAGARLDPEQHPVRFVEVDTGWICAGGDPQERLERVVAVVRRLGLNGVRLLPGGGSGAWFPTRAATVRGDVVGPLARALHAAGVTWVAVDVAASGDLDRDLTLARDLALAVDLDVAVLPAGAGAEGRLGEVIRSVRPAARLAIRTEALGERAFHLAPFAPGHEASRGITVGSSSVALADREATDLAIAGWEWVGLPIDLAELGLAGSLRSLAAFTLPSAGQPTSP